MANDFHSRSTCRLCGSDKLKLVVPFTATPPGDAFVTKEKLNESQKTYPLDMYFCQACASVQHKDVVSPDILFQGYTYKSSGATGIAKHFEEYAQMVLDNYKFDKGALVVEVGSNDGVLLKNFKAKGFRVLGIDPAKEIAADANAKGIETLAEYFSSDLAKKVKQKYGSADIVSANNVFAHIDDMEGLIEGIRHLLSPTGLFVFEASYVVDIVDKMLLGAVFHEHLCHHALTPLKTFFERHGLELFDVKRVSIQGGSIIGFVQPKGAGRKPTAELQAMLKMEHDRGFDQPAVYEQFSQRIMDLRNNVRALLSDLKTKGKKIAGFGAARAGATLVYHFGLADYLDFIVDDNPDKQGKFSPGVHIPVYPTKVMYERKPDYMFLLAWAHANPIIEKHKAFNEQGGHFIVAHPKLEIV